MPRRGKGYSKTAIKKKGKWYGRLRLKTPDGKTKDYARQARGRSHAYQIADELRERYVAGGTEALDADRITFADLAGRYSEVKVVDAVYDGEIKVAGMRSRAWTEREVKTLLEYWGSAYIQDIAHADVERYKLERLRTPTHRGTPRKMATVNHELRRLRAMLNFAKRKSWIKDNPFNQGEPLISEAAEVPRDRGPKPGELERLLAACRGPREHLRAFVLCLVDTALRVGEARSLARGDVDLEGMLITARARNTKTNRKRFVPISGRLAEELRPLLDRAADDHAPIFGPFARNTKAWRSACREAGIEDLQLRDLRHWGATQFADALAEAGLPWQHGMAATGHTQIKTYLRYINKHEMTARRLGEALDSLHAGLEPAASDAGDAGDSKWMDQLNGDLKAPTPN